jgi:hypothetical protein
MKQTDYMILVNEDHRLPENYTDTIELLSVKNAVGEGYQIEKKTYEAFYLLRNKIPSVFSPQWLVIVAPAVVS